MLVCDWLQVYKGEKRDFGEGMRKSPGITEALQLLPKRYLYLHISLIITTLSLITIERGEAAVLRRFGHVERMEKERLVKKIYRAKVEGR